MDWWETNWDDATQEFEQRLAEGRATGLSNRYEPAGDYVLRLDRLARGDRPVIGGAA